MRLLSCILIPFLIRLFSSWGAVAAPPTNPTLLTEEIRAGERNLVPAGTLLETRSYYLDPAGRKVQHGPDIHFSENGKKYRESQYRHGLREGTLVQWDPM